MVSLCILPFEVKLFLDHDDDDDNDFYDDDDDNDFDDDAGEIQIHYHCLRLRTSDTAKRPSRSKYSKQINTKTSFYLKPI